MPEKITVVGAGVSGKALAFWAKSQGAEVFVSDMKTIAPEARDSFREAAISWEEGGHTVRCCECDLMVLSSGVGPQSEAVKMAVERGIVVRGELDCLASELQGKTIAVTGTNGKTTTTALIGHILRSNGLKTSVVGNIGTPLADCAGESCDAIVMELSSFQLYWNRSFMPDTAVLTNLAPDHLDWHSSFENYVESKGRIFNASQGNCWAIVQPGDAHLVPQIRSICTLGPGQENFIDVESQEVALRSGRIRRELFCRDQLKLMGRHNLENAAMATAAVALTFPQHNPSAGLADFQPLPHRCQLVGTWQDVSYVDDSKGTNVASTVTALRGIAGPKIIILGGQGKGETYELLAQTVKEEARAAILLGSEAERIRESLANAGYDPIFMVPSMDAAVKQAIEIARPGDRVLLSPACTSWDMYRNYKERGDHFASLVRAAFR